MLVLMTGLSGEMHVSLHVHIDVVEHRNNLLPLVSPCIVENVSCRPFLLPDYFCKLFCIRSPGATSFFSSDQSYFDFRLAYGPFFFSFFFLSFSQLGGVLRRTESHGNKSKMAQ